MSDQEYSYPEDATVEESHSTGPFSGTESWRTLLKNKRLMYAVGGIVAFYLLVEISVFLFKSPEAVPVEAAPVSVSSAVPVKKEVPKMMIPESLPVEAKQLPVVNVAHVQNTKDVSVLRAQVKHVANVQTQTTLRVTEMGKTLDQLSQQVSQLLEIEKKRVEAKAKAVKKVKTVALQHYFIKATVHGRAWLQRGIGGEETTVKIGDALPTYGKVLAIDAYNGVVKTSSGREIHYASEDS